MNAQRVYQWIPVRCEISHLIRIYANIFFPLIIPLVNFIYKLLWPEWWQFSLYILAYCDEYEYLFVFCNTIIVVISTIIIFVNIYYFCIYIGMYACVNEKSAFNLYKSRLAGLFSGCMFLISLNLWWRHIRYMIFPVVGFYFSSFNIVDAIFDMSLPPLLSLPLLLLVLVRYRVALFVFVWFFGWYTHTYRYSYTKYFIDNNEHAGHQK